MSDKKKAKLAHRDDVPMDVVEHLERQFAESHPGKKVMFAGDHEQAIPPEVRAKIDEVARRTVESRENGTCFCCRKPWDGYDAWIADQKSPHPGWHLCWDVNGEPSHIMCDACDERLNTGPGGGIGMISLEDLFDGERE